MPTLLVTGCLHLAPNLFGMQSSRPTRAAQRAASEAAILSAAVQLFAGRGPDGVSLREVAQSAGLTHALVARYFGSKPGLVSAVEGRLASELRAVMDSVDLTSTEGLIELLGSVRDRPSSAQLLLRSGLGDLDGTAVGAVIAERCEAASEGDRRSRLCGYAGASLLLGWLSWEGFFVAALRLGRMSRRRQDEAMAAAAVSVLQLTNRSEPGLEPRRLTAVDAAPEVPPDRSAREALLASAVELFAERGPASVSIRDVARHAGVNHGLVHRHFGSKDDLLTEAIEVGSASLLPGATAADGFDIDYVVATMHRGSPSAKTIARVLVDDIAIREVRPRYPVIHALLALVRELPADERPAALSDPRLAAAASVSLVVGSVIWGPVLRKVFGLAGDDGIESATADLGRWLIGAPSPPATGT
jgi:TetR/AcrR family transcriptional regulator, repressor for neighboring sulfatase